MGIYDFVVKFFQEGGAFMYPILLVLGLGVAIAVERWLYLSVATGRNRRVWNQVLPLLKAGKLREAKEHTAGSDAAVSRVLDHGLARLASARSREDVEMAMEEGMMEVIPRLEKRTHYLATLANIATLLGLLGTIIGLINAFTAISAANPADKADLLSASISVAMNTTAFGLMVGIPLLLVHAVLQSKTAQLVDSLEMAAVKVLNGLNFRPALKEASGQ